MQEQNAIEKNATREWTKQVKKNYVKLHQNHNILLRDSTFCLDWYFIYNKNETNF